MPNKPKILIFIDWFTPGFKAGGPIKSVSNIVYSLNNDYDFHIVTSDRDINEDKSYKGVELNCWIKNKYFSIIYLTPENTTTWIKNHLRENNYDCYYFNSLFSKNFTISPLLTLNKLKNKKIIIAPRGMLGEGALSIKPFKKKSYLSLAKLLQYYKSVIWHATNIEEKNDIIRVFGKKSQIQIASNISICNISKKELLKPKTSLKIVFFSRISPKKNLLYILKILKELKNISLDIYGSIEDETYWKECSSYIQQNNINATFKGEVLPINVTDTLAKYHFFILPTLHENYGHVIVEALTAGCGLIISNNTPWRNLEEKKIGWDINLNNQTKFIDTLEYCSIMEQDEYNSIRNNCYSFVENEINSNKEIEDTKNLFRTT